MIMAEQKHLIASSTKLKENYKSRLKSVFNQLCWFMDSAHQLELCLSTILCQPPPPPRTEASLLACKQNHCLSQHGILIIRA